MHKILLPIFIFTSSLIFLPNLARADSSGRYFPIYRLYNAATSDRLYTASANEAEKAGELGYVKEGILGYVSVREIYQNQSALYRLYDKKTRRHFYTDNNDELAEAVVKHGYIFEGTLGFLNRDAALTENTEIYRLYNPTTGDHLYTGSWVEDGMTRLLGYRSEGVLAGRLYTP